MKTLAKILNRSFRFTSLSSIIATLTTTLIALSMTLAVNAAPHASFSTGSATSINASTIIGKVFHDKNANGIQDQGEAGIAGVRLATVTGLMLETDGYGRFHLPSATSSQGWSRNFILKLDKASLPQGARLSTENPRVIHSGMGLNSINFGVVM